MLQALDQRRCRSASNTAHGDRAGARRTLGDFVAIQVTAIAMFIVSANVAGRAVARFGAERVILFGTALCAVGAAGQLAYALAGGASLLVVLALFAPINVGLGLRGPPGFSRAVVASRGDDARGSALVILGILGVTATGTVINAPPGRARLRAARGGRGLPRGASHAIRGARA